MPDTPTTFADLVNLFLGLINLLIPIVFGLVFLFLVWKLIEAWVLNPGDQYARAEGKRTALLAVLVLVIMISAWGIVTMIRLSIFGDGI